MEPTEHHEELAARFYAKHVLETLSGRRVRFTCDVERMGHLVEEGAEGTVRDPFLEGGKLVAAVELDEAPDWLEPFDGEVHWVEDINLLDFEEQVTLVGTD